MQPSSTQNDNERRRASDELGGAQVRLLVTRQAGRPGSMSLIPRPTAVRAAVGAIPPRRQAQQVASVVSSRKSASSISLSTAAAAAAAATPIIDSHNFDNNAKSTTPPTPNNRRQPPQQQQSRRPQVASTSSSGQVRHLQQQQQAATNGVSSQQSSIQLKQQHTQNAPRQPAQAQQAAQQNQRQVHPRPITSTVRAAVEAAGVAQHHLARGRVQQRASISSCSSSDSYASSYGSGYASGSGASTDHESRLGGRNRLNVEPERSSGSEDKEATPTPGSLSSGAVSTVVTIEATTIDATDDQNESISPSSSTVTTSSVSNSSIVSDKQDDNVEDELDGEGSSQLRRHLNELEQLTDQLASHNILSTTSTSSTTTTTTTVRDQQQSCSSQSRSTTATPSSVISRPTTQQQPPTPPPLPRREPDEGGCSSAPIVSSRSQLEWPGVSRDRKSQVTGDGSEQHQSVTTTTPPTNRSAFHHNLFQWEQLVSKGVTRPLLINELDFTDLQDDDDCDLLNVTSGGQPTTGVHQRVTGRSIDADEGVPRPLGSSGAPPPPPPISPHHFGARQITLGLGVSLGLGPSPSPSPFGGDPLNREESPAPSMASSSGLSRNSVCLTDSYGASSGVGGLRSASSMSSLLFGRAGGSKRKKTMKLFWKEVREERSLLAKLTKKRTIWDEIKPVPVDATKLEHLFESRAKEIALSKSRNGLDGPNGQRKAKICVLDAKRSNAINIGMTKLPPMRTIKSAILKMDNSIMNREGIDKILTTMMPSEEEKSRIIEAQLANPDTPLGTAEQFLLNLASISALEARLKLWAFQLDYATIEKEVAEPLMDLKQAVDEVQRSETFRIVLGTLLSIGNFLNASSAKGFLIDYLEKVPEVKDTVHKHSLLHHLCLFVYDTYDRQQKPTSDLYSEFGALNRASKVDYAELAKNLRKMQHDCKASWDYLKIVAKHDGLANMMSNSGSGVSSNDINPAQQDAQLLAGRGKLNNLGRLALFGSLSSSESDCQPGSAMNPNNANTTRTVNPNNNNNMIANNNKNCDLMQNNANSKQLKTKVSDFLTDCAERIMVLMVIHRRVVNRFQKLLVYLGYPSHLIKQAQPQQILKVINEFALEYKTKRERIRELLQRRHHQCQHNFHPHAHLLQHTTNHQARWRLSSHYNNHHHPSAARNRWAGSQQCIVAADSYLGHQQRPCSSFSNASSSGGGGGGGYLGLGGGGGCDPDSELFCCSLVPGRNQSVDRCLPSGQQPGRACSPSGCSQISNYSDFLFDQASSLCCSRQQSVTPTPGEPTTGVAPPPPPPPIDEARRRDEQLRRLLGAGKSLDGACGDLYQLGHWSSTMTRTSRAAHHQQQHQQPASSANQPAESSGKLRAASIDQANQARHQSQQSSFYKHLAAAAATTPRRGSNEPTDDPNSDDEEILQSLVRTATGSSSHHHHHHHHQQQQQQQQRAASHLLSRFASVCDRTAAD